MGRFFQNRNLFLISGDVVDSRLNSGDLLGFFIRNFGIEFFFQRHYQFNGIQRVSAQVVDEGGSVLHVLFFNTQLFDDDFLYAFFDVAHDLNFPLKIRYCVWLG